GDRAEFANSKDADIFLSLHIGKHRDIILYAPVITEPDPSYIKTFLINKGQEGYTAKTENLKEAIQKTIIEEFGENMVSAKPLPYSILSKIESAALIIELPSFLDAHYDDEFKNKVANTIYKGINLYEKDTAN
ncbi:MAG: N-acetylmuramoyl-L-alanine amidase, partial [Nitrospirota bacterium]